MVELVGINTKITFLTLAIKKLYAKMCIFTLVCEILLVAPYSYFDLQKIDLLVDLNDGNSKMQGPS